MMRIEGKDYGVCPNCSATLDAEYNMLSIGFNRNGELERVVKCNYCGAEVFIFYKVSPISIVAEVEEGGTVECIPVENMTVREYAAKLAALPANMQDMTITHSGHDKFYLHYRPCECAMTSDEVENID